MYHYTESGLNNVWLTNGFEVRKVDGEDAVAIRDLKGLHKAIGKGIARKPHLTGAELRFLRKEMGLSQRRLGELLGVSEETISLWERRGRMPKGYDRLVRVLYLECLNENVKLLQMIERLIDLDRKDPEKTVFEDTASGWKMAA